MVGDCEFSVANTRERERERERERWRGPSNRSIYELQTIISHAHGPPWYAKRAGKANFAEEDKCADETANLRWVVHKADTLYTEENQL